MDGDKKNKPKRWKYAKIAFWGLIAIYICFSIMPDSWRSEIYHQLKEAYYSQKYAPNVTVANVNIEVPDGWHYTNSKDYIVLTPRVGDSVVLSALEDKHKIDMYSDYTVKTQKQDSKLVRNIKVGNDDTLAVVSEWKFNITITCLAYQNILVEVYINREDAEEASLYLERYLHFLENNVKQVK